MTQGNDPNGNNGGNTARKKGLLKPWQPGQSGNPSGRPVMPPAVKKVLEGGSLDAVKKQVELLQSKDPRIVFLASQAILDRLYGKAAQAVDKNVTVTNVQQAHLQILLELQARHAGEGAKLIEATSEPEKKTEEGA